MKQNKKLAPAAFLYIATISLDTALAETLLITRSTASKLTYHVVKTKKDFKDSLSVALFLYRKDPTAKIKILIEESLPLKTIDSMVGAFGKVGFPTEARIKYYVVSLDTRKIKEISLGPVEATPLGDQKP